ncbi:MAG: sugar ABC transporter permease [Chloroflexi bacterium]|nr:sugar ABC transporter permease [Chloroflexota bacterium]
MVGKTREVHPPAVRMRFVRLRRESTGLLFVLPTVLVMLLVIAYPLLDALRLSVSDVQLNQSSTPFVGLANFAAVVSDRVFANALRNTIVWTVLSVALVLLIGLAAALLVNEHLPGRGLIRSLILVPWIVPAVVVAVVWKWLYNPDFGVIQDTLNRIGLSSIHVNWLADPRVALYAVIAVNVWKSFPFAMLMVLAGLQSAPVPLYEAARVDGAGAWQRLLYVTLPHLRPTLIVLALLLTIWNLNTFTYIYVLTGGGPVRLTEVLGVYIYNTAFQGFHFGVAAAAAVIVFLLSGLLTVVYIRALGGETA